MDKIFFKDQIQELSYSKLIFRLNTLSNVVTNYYHYTKLEFFINFIAGLISNLDMTILDNDFSELEVSKLSEGSYKEKIITINPLNIKDVSELINRVQNSKSKVIMFTSGTTGIPKKVEHSIESLIKNIKIGTKFSDDVWGFAYNPTHMAGLQVFFQSLLNSNLLVDIFGLTKLEILNLIDKYKITNISATPTFYRLLIPCESKFNYVKQITFGGEKSDILLQDKVLKIFPNAKFRNIYASTEAGALLASNNENFSIPEKLKEKIKIVDGEIYIHKSIIGNTKIIDTRDQWYKSGDIVQFVDRDNKEFKIISRKSDTINVGGYKVNPNEVESIIREIDGIQDVKVYGIPNSILGNILCADIVKIDENISEFSIKKHLIEKLQNYKVPRKIYFKNILTINRTGKIDRKKIS